MAIRRRDGLVVPPTFFSMINPIPGEENVMIEFMLKIFSAITGINMRYLHDTPFAMPLLFMIFVAFMITITVLHFIDDRSEEQEDHSDK